MFGDPPSGILVPPPRGESYDLSDLEPSDSSRTSNTWLRPSTEPKTSCRNLIRDGSSCSVILTWQTGFNDSTWLKSGLGKTAQPYLHQGPLFPRWNRRRRQRILNPAGSAILRTKRDLGPLRRCFCHIPCSGYATTLDSFYHDGSLSMCAQTAARYFPAGPRPSTTLFGLTNAATFPDNAACTHTLPAQKSMSARSNTHSPRTDEMQTQR